MKPISFKKNPLTLEENIKLNALNARLFAWMLAVNPEEKTGGSIYAFTTKRLRWDGRPYGILNFTEAYFILSHVENGESISLRGECDFLSSANTVLKIRNPFYFTWAVIFAYLRLDKRFKLYPGVLMYQLAQKLEEVHATAYKSLLEIIDEEISQQMETEIAINSRDHIIDVMQQFAQMQDEALIAQKKRNAEMDEKLAEVKKESNASEEEMMGFYFCKIAEEYINKSKKKKQGTREKIKESLESIMCTLKLYKYVPDELQETISSFDNETLTPQIVNNIEVQAGGTNICHTDNVNNK